MQSTWYHNLFGLEPYEELQLQTQVVSVEPDSQPNAPSLTQSPFGMEPPPPKNARTSKKSLFSRKPVRRSSTDAGPHSPPTNSLPPDHPTTQDHPAEPLHSPSSISREPSSDTLSPNSNRSIIPESIRELPSWYNTESELAAATTRQFRGRYPIHNPVGPRCYRNVHLSPPNRPASVFSPSFPPMSTEPAPTTSPSRTPSGSPLPTPSSSQTGIPDPSGKLRTRKISNTTPDNVDLLDASDPYGTNWHHESPYDGLGLSGDRNGVSPDGPDTRPPPRSRSRMSTPGTHHRTTTPSPLSQSTSAIPVQPVQPAEQDVPSLTRKLTKRRKPFEGIFGFSPSASASAPTPDTASSIAPSTRTVTNRLFKRRSIMKSSSTSSIPQTISNASIIPSEKRQKHSSMFGRFARRFSIVRRVTPGQQSRRASTDTAIEWSRGERHSLQVTDRMSTITRPPSLANPVSPPENRQSTRGSPPQAEGTPSPDSTPLGTPQDEQARDGEQAQDGKRDSVSSLQVPYSIGPLTVANPDAPSVDSSPVNQIYPLPTSKAAVAPAPLPPQSKEKPLSPSMSSSPVFLEIPKFESLRFSMPISNGDATTAAAAVPVTRATSGERRTSQPPPSSIPIPIPPASPKNEKRTSRTSAPSATPAPASAPLPPPIRPPPNGVSVSVPPALEDSPLSRASIIANPPTPYVEPNRINNPPVTKQEPTPPLHLSIPSPVVTPIIPSPQAVPSSPESHTPRTRESQQTRNQGSRPLKSNSSVRSRETETFHLVRSPSAGAVQPTGQSITVAGEQWQVVGGGTQRSRTKKEKDDARRISAEPERRDSRRQERTSEKVLPPTPKSDPRKLRSKDSSSTRKHSSQTESRDHLHRSPTAPASRASGMLSPAPAPERRSSQSQGRRPTSELTPAADMNALRAREVWEMDRLWKGRSVAYGLEGPQVVYAQSIGDVGSTTSVNGVNHHGSTHTSYKLQQGFPFPTTSGVYSSPALSPAAQLQPLRQQPQQPQSFGQTMHGALYEFPSGVRSYPDLANIPSIGTPESTPSMPSRNPLPAPPRQSSFRPGPVPASFVERDDSTTAEYWNKYAGVSVASPTR